MPWKTLYPFLSVIIGIALGASIGVGLAREWAKRLRAKEQAETDSRIKQAEAKEQEVLQRAKEKAIKILEDARLEEKRGLEQIKKDQTGLIEREEAFSKKLIEIDTSRQEVEKLRTQTEEARKAADTIRIQAAEILEKTAGMSREQALEQLLKKVEEEQAEILLSRLRKVEETTADEVDKKAKSILSLAIQRQASSHVAETTTSYVELPNDEMKGRIIGREGRNIKALELLTGCEFIVDDTPGMVTISGFSPIRRQIAKRALEKLVTDGRIQPSRIEETIEEAKRDLAVDIRKSGENALFELGIPMAGIDPKLIQILGRLRYRTSYGQNALMHSMEVANLSAVLAEELGADVMVCKKGGLLHDVGKAVDHDMQGSHPELGYRILKKFGFPEEICYQSIGHHEDKPKTLEAIIVKAADAISGARPGARKDNLELYVKRLEDLEATATRFPGVEKAYAIQAGREIRVFVNPQTISDLEAYELAKKIATTIEAELKHPGEVRVTLIRETRVIEYAR
jgi:ribonuclease Y